MLCRLRQDCDKDNLELEIKCGLKGFTAKYVPTQFSFFEIENNIQAFHIYESFGFDSVIYNSKDQLTEQKYTWTQKKIHKTLTILT